MALVSPFMAFFAIYLQKVLAAKSRFIFISVGFFLVFFAVQVLNHTDFQ